MKSKDVKKLYSTMKPKTLSVMAFESLIAQDRENLKAITRSVPRYNYNCTDTEYTKTLDHYFQIASIWSVGYWKHYAKMAAAMGAGLLESDQSSERASELHRLEYEHESRLRALGMMLNQLQDLYGLDVMTLPTFADAIGVYGLDENPDSLSEDAELYYQNHLEFFRSLIDGTETSPEVDAYFGCMPSEDLVTH